METDNKTAIVLGATGLVGGLLLDLLLRDERYQKVIVYSRRDFQKENSKLEKRIGDLLKLRSFPEPFMADEVYCCIGTTKAKTPDKEQYRKIDYGIPAEAADLCQENKVHTFIVISSMGANKDSTIFYNKVKGEMEHDVLERSIPRIHIVQPALIGGEREEKRAGELFFKGAMSTFEFLMIGPLKKYRTIHPSAIAKAMLWLGNNPYDEKRITSEKLKMLADHGAS